MRKRLFAVVSAIFVFPFAYPHSALSWELELNFLSYQEAAWMCSTGSLQACETMYAYEMARSGVSGRSQVSGGRPADSTMPQHRTISASPNNEDSPVQPPRNK